MLLGPSSADEPPETLTLKLRRFRCRNCEALITSVPRGLLRYALYGAVAIALALALWAQQGQPGVVVRARVSPWRQGSERWHGWRSLRRWARSAPRLWRSLCPTLGSARQQGLSVVTQLAARAPAAAGPVVQLACAGALRS
jgi:hypothetical protein